MSGYARAAHTLGASVSGSDRSVRACTPERLREEGEADAKIGHDAANVPDGGDVEIVYSSAVPPENPVRPRRAPCEDSPTAPGQSCWPS